MGTRKVKIIGKTPYHSFVPWVEQVAKGQQRAKCHAAKKAKSKENRKRDQEAGS